MVLLRRLLWCVTFRNHASFCLLTVAKRGSCGPTKKVLLVMYSVVDLALQVGDAEKSPKALGFNNLVHFLRVSKQGPCLTVIGEDEDDKRLVRLEVVCEADCGVSPDPV